MLPTRKVFSRRAAAVSGKSSGERLLVRFAGEKRYHRRVVSVHASFLSVRAKGGRVLLSVPLEGAAVFVQLSRLKCVIQASSGSEVELKPGSASSLEEWRSRLRFFCFFRGRKRNYARSPLRR